MSYDLIFFVGTTESVISVQILSDFEPERAEEFHINLTRDSGDVVLVNPSIASVIINRNDKPNGVLSLKTVQGITFPSQNVSEDDTTQPVELFIVTRSGGLFGPVSIGWELIRNNSEAGPVKNDITPTEGTVVLQERQREQAITFTIVDDEAPEVGLVTMNML